MSTYYISNSGSDALDGKSPANAWQTLNMVSWGSSFLPSDTVLLQGGGRWREMLTINASGGSGTPIRFGAYGGGALPIITGADVLTGWTAPGGGFASWHKTVATQPRVVLYDGAMLTRNAVGDSVSLGQWDWVSNVLYVNVGENPATHPLEAAQRDYCIAHQHDYVEFADIELAVANLNTFHGSAYDRNKHSLTLDRMVLRHAYGYGAYFEPDGSGHSIENVAVRGCTVYRNGRAGVHAATSGEVINGLVIARNSIYGNNWRWDDDALDKAGIHLFGPTLTNATIEENDVYDNGDLLPSFQNVSLKKRTGHGIHADDVGSGVRISRNRVRGNNNSGILVEISNGAIVDYNVCYGHAGGPAISLWRWTKTLQNNVVAQNLCYNNWAGVAVWGDTGALTAGSITGNKVQNNICAGNTYALVTRAGGENDGTYGSGNVYTFNAFGPQATNFIEWGVGTFKSTYSAFATAYGAATNSVTADPLLTNPGSGVFTLQPKSPCRNTGVDLGSTLALGLGATSTWPSGVVRKDQRTAGQGWDMGPYPADEFNALLV